MIPVLKIISKGIDPDEAIELLIKARRETHVNCKYSIPLMEEILHNAEDFYEECIANAFSEIIQLILKDAHI